MAEIFENQNQNMFKRTIAKVLPSTEGLDLVPARDPRAFFVFPVVVFTTTLLDKTWILLFIGEVLRRC